MVDRLVVGAHYGFKDWLLQRVTAVVMIIYVVALLVLLLSFPSSYEGWKALFATTWVRIFSLVTILALLLHAWVGMRDFWMDYVKPVWLRLSLHVATIIWLLASGIYAVKVLWGV
jgi:succinate dehydrogenase / fumarate reductase membrane anchor subunit